MFLRPESIGFIFKIFSIAHIFCNINNKFLGRFNNLISNLSANSLNFVSTPSAFITVFIFSILVNLFTFSILSSSVSLFVDSILILCYSILLTFFNFSVSVFIFNLFSVSCSSVLFQNLFFHYFCL